MKVECQLTSKNGDDHRSPDWIDVASSANTDHSWTKAIQWLLWGQDALLVSMDERIFSVWTKQRGLWLLLVRWDCRNAVVLVSLQLTMLWFLVQFYNNILKRKKKQFYGAFFRLQLLLSTAFVHWLDLTQKCYVRHLTMQLMGWCIVNPSDRRNQRILF